MLAVVSNRRKRFDLLSPLTCWLLMAAAVLAAIPRIREEWPSEGLVGHWVFNENYDDFRDNNKKIPPKTTYTLDHTEKTGYWSTTTYRVAEPKGRYNGWYGMELSANHFGGCRNCSNNFGISKGYTGPPIRSKTIVTRLMFSPNHIVGTGGSIGSLCDGTNKTFDAIQYERGDGTLTRSFFLGSENETRSGLLQADDFQGRSVRIAVVMEELSDTRIRVIMYQDGIVRRDYIADAPMPTYSGPNTTFVWGTRVPVEDDYLGGYASAPPYTSKTPPWGGAVDNVVVGYTLLYNRALTETEIVQAAPVAESSNGTFLRAGGSRLADARRMCSKNGLHIAQIRNQEELDEATEIIPAGTSVFVGGSANDTAGNWMWEDGPGAGNPFYTETGNVCHQGWCKWLPGEPNSTLTGTRLMKLEIDLNNVTHWIATEEAARGDTVWWLCQREPYAATEWRGGELTVFQTFTKRRRVSLDYGLVFCTGIGGFLATITTRDEAQAVNRLLEPGFKYLTSGSDVAVEGEWRWLAGNYTEKGALISNGTDCAQFWCGWAPTQPDGNSQHELYIEKGTDEVVWYDDQGSTEQEFGILCEFHPPTPTATITFTPTDTVTPTQSITVQEKTGYIVETVAFISNPEQMAFVPHLGLYVVQGTPDNCIAHINVDTGGVAVIAGRPGAGGAFADGAGTSSRWDTPQGIAYDVKRTRLIVVDSGNSVLRSIDLPSAEETPVIAGQAGIPGALDGPFGNNTLRTSIFAIAIDSVTGDGAYFSDGTLIRKLDFLSGVVTTIIKTLPISVQKITSILHFAEKPEELLLATETLCKWPYTESATMSASITTSPPRTLTEPLTTRTPSETVPSATRSPTETRSHTEVQTPTMSASESIPRSSKTAEASRTALPGWDPITSWDGCNWYNWDTGRVGTENTTNGIVFQVNLRNPANIIPVTGHARVGYRDEVSLTEARFADARGLCSLHHKGNLLAIVDDGNHYVRSVDLEKGMVSRLAGEDTGETPRPLLDGPSRQAIFGLNMTSCTTAFDYNIFVAEKGNGAIRRVFIHSSPTPSATHSLPPTGCALLLNEFDCQEDQVSLCYWSSVHEACIPLATLVSIANRTVVRTTIPEKLAAAQYVPIEVYGSLDLAGASLAVVNATEPCTFSAIAASLVPLAATLALGAFTGRHEYLINAPFSMVGEQVRYCLVPLSGSPIALAGNGSLVVDHVFPTLRSCSLQPRVVYDNEPVDIVFLGFGFNRADRVALVPFATDGTLDDVNCSTVPEASFYEINEVALDRTSSVFQSAVNSTQVAYAICYAGPAAMDGSLAEAEQCPGLIVRSSGIAPWLNPNTLTAAGNALFLGVNYSLIQSNMERCSSMQPGAEALRHTPNASLFATVLLSPSSRSSTFGTLGQPYGLGEVCMVAMDPVFFDGAGARPSAALQVKLGTAFTGGDVSVLVFSKTRASSFPPTVPFVEHTRYFGDNCPTAIPGHHLWHYYTRRGEEVSADLRVPFGPAVVIVCSSLLRVDRGKTLSVTYIPAETMCPNDCRDGAGIARGLCDPDSQRCACHPLWEGEGCRTFIGCETGLAAPTLTGYGRGVVHHLIHEQVPETASGNYTCGYMLVPDNTFHGRRGALGVGVSLAEKASLSSYDCDTHRVRFLAEAHDGPEIRRWCRADIERLRGTDEPWLVAVNATPVSRVYVEVRASREDFIDINFASVALSCPGIPNNAMFVEPSGMCSGRGACVDIDYNNAPMLYNSLKGCDCDTPFGTSMDASTCDSCAFGYDPMTYPICTPLPVCPQNCSCHGQCTAAGCVCDPGYFGRACNNRKQDVQIESELVLRGPFDNGTSGDATKSGTIDSQLVTCELTGSCLPIVRTRGRSYPAAFLEEAGGTCAISTSRRQSSNVTSSDGLVSRRGGGGEYGFQLNKLSLPGALGDVSVQHGVAGSSADISDSFTITAWVQLTADSNGWLYAKTDTAQSAEGRYVVLDAAVREVRDRHTRPRSLDSQPLSVYIGIYANGIKKQIDVMFTQRKDDGTAEIAIRHFRLGSDAQKLFDGVWRYFAVVFDGEDLRGQVYVDGRSSPLNSNYVQCFPFGPTTIASPVNISSDYARKMRISSYDTSGSAVVGHGLSAGIDEVRVYSKALSMVTIAEVGGPTFEEELNGSRAANIAMAAVGLVTVAIATTLCVGRVGRDRLRRHREESNAEDTAVAPDGKFDDTPDDLDIDAWVQMFTPPDLETDLAKGLATLRKAVEALGSRNGGPRQEVPQAIHSPTTAEDKVMPGNEGSRDGDEEATLGEAEGDKAAAAALVEDNDDDAERDAEPPREDAASPLPLFVKSQRGSHMLHVAPEPFDPATWEVFLSPLVATKPIAQMRLRQWILRRFFLDGSSLGSKAIIALLLEDIVSEFVAAHHGTPDETWRAHPDVDCLRRRLNIFAAMRTCRTDEEIAAFHKKLLAETADRDEAGDVTHENQDALAAIALEQPMDNGMNRRMLAIAAATIMAGKPGATTQPQFKSTLEFAFGDEEVPELAEAPYGASSDAGLTAAAAVRSALAQAKLFVSHRGGLLQRIGLVRDFWQLFALLLTIMTFPPNVTSTIGRFATFISLSFSSSGNNVHFEVTFAVCCTLGMLAFLAMLVVFVGEMRTPVGPRRLEKQLREQLQKQKAILDDGKPPRLQASPREKLAKLSTILLTTMYLPTTRVILMGLVCHEQVLCLYDCYVNPRHKLIVGVGIVVGLCVTIAAPIMLWKVTSRKRREFVAFVGEAALTESPPSSSGTSRRQPGGEALWTMMVTVDVSPFSTVYSSFRRRWGQFAVVILGLKAFYAIIALSTDPDTTTQIVAVVVTQSLFTATAAVVSPFRFRSCSILLASVHVSVLFVLATTAIFRVQPDVHGSAVGSLQLAILSVVLIASVPALLVPDRSG